MSVDNHQEAEKTDYSPYQSAAHSEALMHMSRRSNF